MTEAYAVVIFSDDNCVSVVPVSWLDGDFAYWAPYSTQEKFDRAVKCGERPKQSWTKYPVRILGIKDSYGKARTLLPTAEWTSDINTEDEDNLRKRTKRIPQHLMDSSDDAEQPATKVTKVTSKVQRSAAPAVPSLVSQPASVSALSLLPVQSSYSSASVAPAETSLPLQPASALSSTTAEGDTDQPVSSPLAPDVEPLPLASVCSPVVPDRPARTSNATRIIVSLLTEIKSELREVKSQVMQNTQMLQALTSGSNSDVSEDLGIELPVRDSDMLDSLDQKLSQDAQFRKSLVARLAARGGRNLKEIITRIMACLFDNSIVNGLNWSGQCGKRAFGKMKLAEVITAAVRRNRATAGATDADIQQQLVRFMHGAQDREGGRRARQKKRQLLVQQPRTAVVETDSE